MQGGLRSDTVLTEFVNHLKAGVAKAMFVGPWACFLRKSWGSAMASMQPNVQLAGTAAIAGQRGMERASLAIEAAAAQVVAGALEAVGAEVGAGTRDTVTLSDQARSASIEDGLLDASSARITYASNIRVVRATDDRFQQMIDIGLEYVR